MIFTGEIKSISYSDDGENWKPLFDPLANDSVWFDADRLTPRTVFLVRLRERGSTHAWHDGDAWRELYTGEQLDVTHWSFAWCECVPND